MCNSFCHKAYKHNQGFISENQYRVANVYAILESYSFTYLTPDTFVVKSFDLAQFTLGISKNCYLGTAYTGRRLRS